jgi:4-amino-4-deoxy-L-arabinose transferase-like glycosyltransferase
MLVALILRLAMFLMVGSWRPDVERDVIIKSDSRLYHELASYLVEHGTFFREPIRTPGYLLYVAGFYALFGEHPVAPIAGGILLDLAICWLCWLIAGRFIGERVAGWAALFYALDPGAILFSNMLMSDTLFTLLLAGGIVLGERGFRVGDRGRSLRLHAGASALLGLAALTRPIGLYLIPFYLLMIIWHERRFPATAAMKCGAVLLIFLLAVAPWYYRNHREYGVVEFSSSGPLNLFHLYALPTEMLRSKVGPDAAMANIYAGSGSSMDADSTTAASAFEFHHRLGAVARRYLLAHPGQFAGATAIGIGQMYLNSGSGGYAFLLGAQGRKLDMKEAAGQYGVVGGAGATISRKSPVELAVLGASSLFHLVEYALALLGLWALRRRWREPRIAFLIGAIVCYTLLIGASGTMRFKLPVTPLYVGLAGAGCVALLERRNFMKRGAPAS